jgi:hypothetical protein
MLRNSCAISPSGSHLLHGAALLVGVFPTSFMS